ncbi:unnamed protein product, partial [Tetraodon nigroviridis]
LCLSLSLAKSNPPHGQTLSVSASHLYYTCPEGANATLVCNQRGAHLHPNDSLWHLWFFTPYKDQHCTSLHGPRNVTYKHNKMPLGLHFGATQENFWVQLQHVTHADQGRYCCAALEMEKAHHNPVQRTHSHMFLKIVPSKRSSNVYGSGIYTTMGTVPVALAMGACILALLSLPLILVLIYRQRQNTQSSRRAQELVRMDSEVHGHENPVFLGGSPQIQTRTASQIMARQSSDTGRHLLSEPGTPLSPPAHGDVFFPV